MTDVFLKLVNMSFSASWLILAVFILRLLLKKAPKWTHCLLWGLVAIRLICPFSFESPTSLIPYREEVTLNSLRSEVEIQVHTAGTYIPIDTQENPDSPAETQSEGQSETRLTGTILPNLAGLWFGGICLMIVYAEESYRRLRRKVDASIDLGNGVYLCDYIDSPFILGIVNPGIYLPSTLESRDADYVLAHERAHLKRKDHWWKPIGFLLLTVYWFNPVIWAAYILLCRDIELACDEKVVRDMDIPQKKAYSEALLNCSLPRYRITACPLAFGEVSVKERVKSVLNYRRPTFWIILVSVLACIAVALCFLTDPKAADPETETEETASGLQVDDTALLPLYEELPLLPEFDWSGIADQIGTDSLTLFDPQIIDISLFVGVQYDGGFGVAILEPKDRYYPGSYDDEYRLSRYFSFESLNILDGGGAAQIGYDDYIPQFGIYLVWDESITSIVWTQDYSQTIAVDHYPMLCVQDCTGWFDYGIIEFYFDHSGEVNYTYLLSDSNSCHEKNLYHFTPENPLLFPEKTHRQLKYLCGDSVFFYDGINRPGAFTLEENEIAELEAHINSVPEDAISAYGGEFDNSVCVYLAFCEDISRSTVPLEICLKYHDGVVEYVMYDSAGEESELLHAVQIRYEPLNDFLAPLCDNSRRECNALIYSASPPLEYRYLYANMTIQPFINWDYEVVAYTDDNTPFGIRFRPKNQDIGWLFLSFWPGGFDPGEEYSVTAKGGGSAFSTEYTYLYWSKSGDPNWTYQQIVGLAGDYVVINDGADGWLADTPEFSSIAFSHSVPGDGLPTLSEIGSALAALYPDADPDAATAEFDWKTGVWTVYPAGGDGPQSLKIDADGNITAPFADRETATDPHWEKTNIKDLITALEEERDALAASIEEQEERYKAAKSSN